MGGTTPCGGGGKSNGGIPEVGGGTDISGNAGLRLYSRRSAVITWNQPAEKGLDKTILPSSSSYSLNRQTLNYYLYYCVSNSESPE